MAQWDACADDGLTLDDFAGEACWGAIDLASTRDINALTLIFRHDDVYYAFPRFWMPEEPIDIRSKQDRAQAKRWAEKGLIKQTSGNVSDYAEIARDVCEIADRFDLQVLGFDPWNAAAFLQLLSLAGFPEEKLAGGKFGQTINNFAGPSKEFELRIASGTLRHSGCPVMRWMVGNVAAERDKNDNIRPSKSKSADKIDGVVSTIMAIGLALQAGDTTSIYETSGGLAL
jgi:phage terminase large subunit-like protein